MARGQFAYPEGISEEELSILKNREQFFHAAYPGQSLRWVRTTDVTERVSYQLTPYSDQASPLFEITLEELRDEPEHRIKQRIEGGR